MISRLALEERVRQWGLREEVVEKDYVIGWTLWGLGRIGSLSRGWAFKGGTCLKKCYIETFRFSEDLDFTVLPGGPFKPEEVEPLLQQAIKLVQDASGIDFSRQPPRYAVRRNGASAEGRLYYIGPRKAPTVAKIKLDVMQAEEVVRPTELQPIGHSYPDDLPGATTVRCYAFEEVFAEKLRALGERGRPRDLYDVVLLFRRPDLRGHPALIREILEAKCAGKRVPVPALDAITAAGRRAELEAEWNNMLAHQLPVLPPFEHVFAEIPRLFAWLSGEWIIEEPEALPVRASDDPTWSPPALVATWASGVPLEVVRFAAANHLCVELDYAGKKRIIEPYSLRRSREGALLLYGLKLPSREVRCYRADRIRGVRATRDPFKPRFPLEFTSKGRLRARPTSRRQSTQGLGSRFVVECFQCGRRFPRSRRNTSIRPHKGRSGWPCPGRRGLLV